MLEELEELVERTIRHLAGARRAGQTIDVRSLVANLYAFQERYDAADTRERLFDLLVEEHYVYRLALSDHPAPSEALDRLVNDRAFDGIVPLDPEKPLHPVDNPIGGLYVAPHLYVDAGSPLCERLVASGRLSEDAGRTVGWLDAIGMVESLVAACADDPSLVATWYKVLGEHLFLYEGALDEQLTYLTTMMPMRADVADTGGEPILAPARRDPRVARIRAAVAAAGGATADVAMYDDLRASATLIADENGRISDAPPVAARHDPFLTWWDDPRAP